MSESDDVVGAGMFRKVLDEQRSERPAAPKTQVYLSNDVNLLVDESVGAIGARWREALASDALVALTRVDVEDGNEPYEWIVNPRHIVAVGPSVIYLDA